MFASMNILYFPYTGNTAFMNIIMHISISILYHIVQTYILLKMPLIWQLYNINYAVAM